MVEMPKFQHKTLSFDGFILDLTRGRLLRGIEELKLRPKSFEVLKHLVENSNRLVSKAELMHAVWPDSFVTDDSLVQCLIEIRRALGDDPRRYIKTLARRGYVFEAAVKVTQTTAQEVLHKEEVALDEEKREHQAISHLEVVTTPRAADAKPLLSEIRRRRLSLVALLILLPTLGGFGTYLLTERNQAADSKAIDSVAVMPLVNAAGDPNDDYLSDGMSETLINTLTELPHLKVIARTTVFRYKGREVNLQQIRRALNVRAVLTGRVRQMGDRLNVQVDLVDAATGAQLWGEEYDRKISDVLSVKQSIAREVAQKLRLRLSGEDKARLVKRETTNTQAYQSYLRGRHYWNKRTEDGIRKAIEQFQQAVDRDPNYALGYVGLADCYIALEQYAGVPASGTLPKAKAAADRALQLDDSLAEAHTSLALIYRNQWRWAEAEEEFRRAISLNPNYATGHQWFGFYYITKRKFEDALRETKRAQELDPLSPIIADQVAWIYLLKNDLNSVVEHAERNIELNPGFPGTQYLMGSAHLKQGRYEEATAAFQKAVELSGRGSVWLSSLGYCYAVTGRRSHALRIVKELEERYAAREALGQHVAKVYAGLGQGDQSFAWLQRDFELRSGVLPLIAINYGYERLHRDQRYTDLVLRMGLEPDVPN